MNTNLANQTPKANRKVIYLAVFVVLAVLLGVWLDFVEAEYQNSPFYLSESILFSTFWWLFLPGIYLQFYLSGRCRSKSGWILLHLLPVGIHLLAFPAIVWLLSRSFYENTFRYSQTFQFALVEHLFKIVILYSLPLMLYVRFKSRVIPKTDILQTVPIQTFVVSEGNKRIPIRTADILYFSANPPYVTVCHHKKDYLCNETLKSILAKVGSGEFVQIHKSVVVNLAYVEFYTSRQNGDYDLNISNGTKLRLSRTFAKGFKSKFKGAPQDRV